MRQSVHNKTLRALFETAVRSAGRGARARWLGAQVQSSWSPESQDAELRRVTLRTHARMSWS